MHNTTQAQAQHSTIQTQRNTTGSAPRLVFEAHEAVAHLLFGARRLGQSGEFGDGDGGVELEEVRERVALQARGDLGGEETHLRENRERTEQREGEQKEGEQRKRETR